MAAVAPAGVDPDVPVGRLLDGDQELGEVDPHALQGLQFLHVGPVLIGEVREVVLPELLLLRELLIVRLEETEMS